MELQCKGQEIHLRLRDDMFHGEVLYQTSEGSPCDLAFLKANLKNCRFLENVRFAQTEAVKGKFKVQKIVIYLPM